MYAIFLIIKQDCVCCEKNEILWDVLLLENNQQVAWG